MLQMLQADEWPAGLDYRLCPCLNPTGFLFNSRENADRKILNRDYRHLETGEVAAHIRWLERQPAFDAAFCLHEDWEAEGFYLYDVNRSPRPSLAAGMVGAAAAACPIDLSPVIEGRAAEGGIIRPSRNPPAGPGGPRRFGCCKIRRRWCTRWKRPRIFRWKRGCGPWWRRSTTP